MKAIYLNIKSNWAHFRKVETNNNPLTHDFITKTAFIGLLGAVVGIERKEMRTLFPKFSDGLLYSVAIKNPVIKQSWSFTLREIKKHKKSPSQFEVLKDSNFDVIVALKDDSLGKYFYQFLAYLEMGQSFYTPVMGLHNCPAELTFLSEGDLSSENGDFITQGFISNEHTINPTDLKDMLSSRIGFDKMPTYQNDDFWNLPERFVQVSYPTEGNTLSAKGDYYNYNSENFNSQWYLI